LDFIKAQSEEKRDLSGKILNIRSTIVIMI